MSRGRQTGWRAGRSEGCGEMSDGVSCSLCGPQRPWCVLGDNSSSFSLSGPTDGHHRAPSWGARADTWVRLVLYSPYSLAGAGESVWLALHCAPAHLSDLYT
ncbi:hypothetical protein DPEC_G00235720 [Dallia pectoralis]|uniref:Uncharacterized protein n=1 Tax=Dallia pectoralis TaxID=75939 RepID=A0ACC2FYJ5_DALPE|nr:hypothetical protein DPEC_G00235720 [Dallia pectoralis]